MIKGKLLKIITASLLILGAGSAVGAAVFSSVNKQANAYSSISTYYSTVSGSGGTLLNSLYTKIKGNTDLGYKGLWTAYKTTDIRSDGKIYDLYSDTTSYTPGGDQCGTYSNVGDCYNREHTIPKSWWGGAENTQGSDLIIVLPSDGKINGIRSNWPYGETNNGTAWKNTGDTESNYLGTSSNDNYVSGTVFEPFDSRKGDLARTYFYAATRYSQNSTATENLGPVTKWTSGEGSSVFGEGSGYTYGFKNSYLSMLLKWHREDPVSAWEIQRNNLVEDKQGNRNPFIDHPSYVDLIWGGTYGATQQNGESTNSNSTVVNGVITTSGTPTPTKTLSNIAVSNPKTSYTVNDTFVKPTVTATFSDSSTSDVTNSAVFSGYNLSNTGNQTVNVSYTYDGVTKYTSYVITVSSSGGSGSSNDYTIVFDTVSSDDGTELSTTGVYDFTTQNTLVSSISNTSKCYKGKSGLKLGASGSAGSFTASLKSAAQSNISKIVVSSYQYSSDSGSLKLTVGSSSQTFTPSSGLTWEPSTALSGTTLKLETTSKRAYVKSITFTIGSSTPTPTPTLASIAVSGQTTTFDVGDTFSFGGTVTATYSNGSTADVTSSTTFSGYNMSIAGTQEVTASYTEGSITETAKYNITVNQQQQPSGDTYSVNLSGGTYSGGSISWKSSDGHTTITQTKATGTSDVSSSYISAPRIYKGHVLSFAADSGYKLLSISLTYDGTYCGNSMTAGVAISNNVVTDNTTSVSRTWASSSDGTHIVGSVSSSGLSTIYIQNVASGNNVQLRPTAISITYVANSSSQTAATWATSFLTLITCNNGVTAPSTSNWATTRTNFLALSTTEQNNVKAATANENGTDLQKAIARYTYIVNKYTNRTNYPDYLNKASQSNMMTPIQNNSVTTILVAISALSILSGMTLVIWLNKKKKEN